MNDKAQTIIRLAKERIGQPYVFGALGEACTPANRERRKRYGYPSIVDKCQVLNGNKATCAGCKWKGMQIYDCRGFTYWLLKQVGITISTVGATTQYNTKSHWVEQGEIKDMPNVVCCVFKYRDGKMQHTGMHIGDGVIIHCSGTVKTAKTTDNGWTHYAIPKGLYDGETEVAPMPMTPTAPITSATADTSTTILKRGSKGEAVVDLQRKLLTLGYSLPKFGADGSFGAETDGAVRRFQGDYGLTVDGKAGNATLTALNKAVEGERFTVTIPNLDAAAAADLIAKYPKAMKVKT